MPSAMEPAIQTVTRLSTGSESAVCITARVAARRTFWRSGVDAQMPCGVIDWAWPQDDILLAGYLQKKKSGEGRMMLGSSWNTRFFVLHRNVLKYYEVPDPPTRAQCRSRPLVAAFSMSRACPEHGQQEGRWVPRPPRHC